MASSILRSAAAAGAVKAIGMSFAMQSFLLASTLSRPLSQLTLGFEELKKWKQDKATGTQTNPGTPLSQTIALSTVTAAAAASNMNTTALHHHPAINTPILQHQLQTQHHASHTLHDVSSPDILRRLVPRVSIHDSAAPKSTSTKKKPTEEKNVANKPSHAGTTTTNNNKSNSANTKTSSSARLSESHTIYDPTDPDYDLRVDPTAYHRREIPLFLGWGPFW